MNKLLIPVILTATIMIAGMFAFIPVDQVSTYHLFINQAVSGVQTTVSGAVTSVGVDNEDIFHWFILNSSEPFTLHDITVRGEVIGGDDSGDEINAIVLAYPEEYGLNATAADVDNKIHDICDDCDDDSSSEVVDGDDDVNPRTWSMNAVDAAEGTGSLTFGPDQNIVVEVCFDEDTDGASDFSAVVTFHLRGVTADEVSIHVLENIHDPDALPADDYRKLESGSC